MDLKRVTCLIGDQEEVINIEDEDNNVLRQEFENILTNLKEQTQRQQEQKKEKDEEIEEAIVVERKQLVNSLVLHTNDTKKNVWTRIKTLTGWTNSRTEITSGDVEGGSFKYKIVY